LRALHCGAVCIYVLSTLHEAKMQAVGQRRQGVPALRLSAVSRWCVRLLVDKQVVPRYKSVNPAKDLHSFPRTPPMPRVGRKHAKHQQHAGPAPQQALPVDDGTITTPGSNAMIQP
jgi:hypothetical protein